MILRTEVVEQAIDGDRHVTLIKEVVMTAAQQPLGMVRKRSATREATRGLILLVHGFGQNRYTWHVKGRSFSAMLADEGWDVFNLELRGHGRSRRYGTDRPHLLDDYIREDLPIAARAAMRISGHDRVFLVGHSMGGIISYCAAATLLAGQMRGIATIGAPYRFGKGSALLSVIVTIADSLRFTGLLDASPYLPLRFVGQHLRQYRAIWDLSFIPAPLRAWVPGSTEEEILEQYLSTAFDWAAVKTAYELFRAGSEAAFRSYDGTIDYSKAFETMDIPLLVIAGAHDKIAPPESVEPAYAHSGSSDRTFRVFPLGHIDLIVGREAPSTVWPVITDWLARR